MYTKIIKYKKKWMTGGAYCYLLEKMNFDNTIILDWVIKNAKTHIDINVIMSIDSVFYIVTFILMSYYKDNITDKEIKYNLIVNFIKDYINLDKLWKTINNDKYYKDLDVILWCNIHVKYVHFNNYVITSMANYKYFKCVLNKFYDNKSSFYNIIYTYSSLLYKFFINDLISLENNINSTKNIYQNNIVFYCIIHFLEIKIEENKKQEHEICK